MKFKTYVNKIVLDRQLNSHKDPCKDARAQGENARTCNDLQRFRSESTKIKKMRFSAISELTPKKVILFTFANQAKFYEFSKTEYSDSTSFINRLTPLIFF